MSVRNTFLPRTQFSEFSLVPHTSLLGEQVLQPVSAVSMRKQLDPRIPVLINNNVKKNHRSFIVLVGDKGRDQVCASSRDC